jgi:hypothetical protein
VSQDFNIFKLFKIVARRHVLICTSLSIAAIVNAASHATVINEEMHICKRVVLSTILTSVAEPEPQGATSFGRSHNAMRLRWLWLDNSIKHG